jgi:hypothetical protein
MASSSERFLTLARSLRNKRACGHNPNKPEDLSQGARVLNITTTKESTMKRQSLSRLSAFLTPALAVGLFALPVGAKSRPWGIVGPDYTQVIQQVVNMPSDGSLQQRASRHGLNVVNVMWEDTGRAGGSSVGPNISDLTLQVRQEVNGGTRTHLLPVIRHPNYSDKTGDIAADKIWVKVGNQHEGGKSVAVPLTEVLGNMKEYLSDPGSLKGDGNFLSKKDSHFLVSAQHVFLPIPKRGKAEFNPVLYNYQSAPQSPAVLTLLVTRQGTSATIIDNRGGDQSWQGWGQQLFFNNGGQKTVFTAERKSDVKNRIERKGKATGQDVGAMDEGADMMMVIQVPLKHKNRGHMAGLGGMPMDDADMEMPAMESAGAAPPPMASKKSASRRARSDVEKAVLGHGDDLGPFDEMGRLKLERDERFPVRVTVQFYKATSNGVVSDQDLADVAKTINKVYDSADYVGSLVVPEGARHRPTDWIKNNPKVSWNPNTWHRMFASWAW